MKPNRSIPQVGAPDPELPNSPIALEEDEETDVLRQQLPGEPFCVFNGQEFPDDTVVASGSRVLRCVHGLWVESGDD